MLQQSQRHLRHHEGLGAHRSCGDCAQRHRHGGLRPHALAARLRRSMRQVQGPRRAPVLLRQRQPRQRRALPAVRQGLHSVVLGRTQSRSWRCDWGATKPSIMPVLVAAAPNCADSAVNFPRGRCTIAARRAHHLRCHPSSRRGSFSERTSPRHMSSSANNAGGRRSGKQMRPEALTTASGWRGAARVRLPTPVLVAHACCACGGQIANTRRPAVHRQ